MIIKAAIVFLTVFDWICNSFEWGKNVLYLKLGKQTYETQTKKPRPSLQYN